MPITAFEVRRDNLRRLVLDKFEGNRAALARAADVHQNQINLMLSDNEQFRRNMGEALARRMEESLGLAPGFFDAANMNAHGATFQIAATEVPAQLSSIFRADVDISRIELSASQLDALAGKITTKENLTIARIGTHDMSPLIDMGQHVVVDAGVKTVTTDGVYILGRGQDVFLRRVNKQLSGGWVINTPNPNHEPLRVESLKGVKAVGKIVMLLTTTIL